ncbi:hypothetical protein JTE90_002885 [Oedothorax gibbosus]|uniref:Uncharacterized protein n=1 Tax=Oedothorax gibbosus TaxID=931172 RepID=A0AAV6VAY8_9ARAC|nr:hypothetical protein JTE90_002885 [Oedothorax gibbosus]
MDWYSQGNCLLISNRRNLDIEDKLASPSSSHQQEDTKTASRECDCGTTFVNDMSVRAPNVTSRVLAYGWQLGPSVHPPPITLNHPRDITHKPLD